MTVEKLIKILETMPKDADVLRLSTDEDSWYSEYEYINHVKYNDGEVLLE